ncbi:hypothetical protein NQ318_006475 [Aromia moschata]|uniref:DUF4817 domain-containing protein n=1 Tax=Aromia moschata TaxID=1265417 RepID=A0AAV8X3T3_9CUCU|nr:hypothetical protein NQ318_006475 [Aromia moschata]
MMTRIFMLQFREMVYLTEVHKITILQMIDFGDRTRTQAEVVRLFQEKYLELPPISQSTVMMIINWMLEENPHTSSSQTVSALNISHSSILRVLTENQMHPNKLVPTNEFAENDFDR